MKRLSMMAVLIVGASIAWADTWIDPHYVTWTYYVEGDGITIGSREWVEEDGYYEYGPAIRQEDADSVLSGNVLSIPSVINGTNVTSIGKNAFDGIFSDIICRVVIPEGVKNIGDSAFDDCGRMHSVYSSGKYYYGCSGIEKVNIPEGVTNIGRYAFFGCQALKSITLPATLSCLGPSAFNGCVSLQTITIPSNVTDIASYAFANCYSSGLGGGLTNVVISKGVRSIGSEAFYNCKGLLSVSIPTSVAEIGENAFMGCTLLSSLTIPEGVTSLGDSAFSDCPIISMVLPSSLTVIGENVFGDDAKLRKVTFNGAVPQGWSRAVANPTTKVYYKKEYESQWKSVLGDIGEESGFICTDSSGSSGTGSAFTGTIVVTNVVIHYVVNSIQSNLAVPITTDTKFVNVMTEIKGGNVAIPDTWVANYPTFATKFGTDFTTALTKTTGKTDAAGNPMYVWQDYVAGTDPTDEESQFTASVTMVDGKPVISYSPELSDSEKEKRVYKTWGKVKLQDTDWVEVPEDHNADYNFFKVTVEMK